MTVIGLLTRGSLATVSLRNIGCIYKKERERRGRRERERERERERRGREGERRSGNDYHTQKMLILSCNCIKQPYLVSIETCEDL